MAKGGKDKIVTEKKKQGMRIVPNRLGYDSTVSVIAPSDKPDQEMARFGYKYQSYLILYAKQHISQANREPSQLTLSVLSFPKSA